MPDLKFMCNKSLIGDSSMKFFNSMDFAV
uniref:Uncharacterized protein n=1 Tax=Arundo donax TaxID=35708 RepID=A0A0A9BFX3_ARUDO